MTDLDGAVLALDVDGVLLDPQRGGRGWWSDDLHAQHGIDRETIQRVFFARKEWDDITHGRLALRDGLATCLADAGITTSADDVIACWFEADWHVNDEMVTAAAEWTAAGARLFLATTQEHARAAFIAERLGALGLPIERMLHSAALGVSKPAPEYFAIATSLIEPRRKDAVVFVDDARSNVEAASAYGWRALHYTGQAGWRDDVAAQLAEAAA